MKSLLIIAIATIGFTTFAQIESKMEVLYPVTPAKSSHKIKISASHIQLATIVDDCHDVSADWFEFGIEERITYKMEKTGMKSVDFDSVEGCKRFSNYLELNGEHKLSELEISRKIQEIKSSRKSKSKKSSSFFNNTPGASKQRGDWQG